jgi:hypothetical protein
VAQKSLPIGVYVLAIVLMRVERGFNSCVAPESLLKTLDDLKPAMEDVFAKIYNDSQLCKTVSSSIPERLQQCLSSEGRQFEA